MLITECFLYECVLGVNDIGKVFLAQVMFLS
jgi:hypothetical protein